MSVKAGQAHANERWVQGTAEDIAALNLGWWRAVTFGQSFNGVRRLEVAEAVYDLLVPGGSLVLISHHVDGRPRPADPGRPEVPRAEVLKLILDYLGDGTRRYLATWNEGQSARFEDTLSQTRFSGSRTIYAPGRPDLIRDIDTVVANYFSLSLPAWRRPGLLVRPPTERVARLFRVLGAACGLARRCSV